MKKVGLVLTPAFIFALALMAQAQKVNTADDRAETLKVTVSGSIDMDAIFRDGELVDARGGEGSLDEDEGTIEGNIRVRLDIELSEKISAVVALRTNRITSGDTLQIGDNPEETAVIVEEVSITLNEFLNPEMKLAMGIVPVAFDLRGKGSAFFFDPAHSNSFAKNTGAGSGSTVVGAEDQLQPTGVHGTYSKDALSAGVFLLPAVIEGGTATGDESAYGVWFFYNLDTLSKGSRAGGILAVDSFAGKETGVITVGGGLDWANALTEGLELYAEIYFQFGGAGQVLIAGVMDDVDAGGLAFQLGGQYNFPGNENNVWVGGNLTMISGDDDSVDSDNDNFLSYENVNDLKILEDQWFGFDLDTNYFAIKVSGGAALTVGSGAMKNNLELSAIVGFVTLSEDVLGANGAFSEGLFPGSTATSEDKIGNEVDLNARYLVSKAVSFDGGVGMLFGADLLEETGTSDEDNCFLFWLGANARW